MFLLEYNNLHEFLMIYFSSNKMSFYISYVILFDLVKNSFLMSIITILPMFITSKQKLILVSKIQATN